ncbi:ankyrin repeat, PH and SEC7 domain containing protein secG-like isoform X2 [Dysidea avara]|uniref:ankyrin repeat, PH and SEC7 domain containing protein secG-like isoform X2 n=1 Tax=Dysidea avara TaxID=196820 RepID=UPI00331F9B89
MAGKDESSSDNSKAHPNLKEVINQLQPESRGTAARWYDVGIQLLGDNCPVLEVIKSNYGGDVNSCCREMLRQWLDLQPNASWNQLIEALSNIGMKSVADKIKRDKIEGKPHKVSKASESIRRPKVASAQFGFLLAKILMELNENESKNLETIKLICSNLTIDDDSNDLYFSSEQLNAIETCPDMRRLLQLLRELWRWDDFPLLMAIVSPFAACQELIQNYKSKLCSEMKLQHIYECSKQEGSSVPDGYDKMIAIVKNRNFSDVTLEEYSELKQFTFKHCGVKSYVICPFCKAESHSLVLEWCIPLTAVKKMVDAATKNASKFIAAGFVYLKISVARICDTRNNKEECKQLLKAASDGHINTIVRLIKFRYIDANTTEDNVTPLYVATKYGHIKIVEMLIKSGAEVNVVTKFHMTPLHAAAHNGSYHLAKMLIKSGADVNATTKNKATPLHFAAYNGHLQMVTYLLKSYANVNATTKDKLTPLYYAAQNGHMVITKSLIKSGANVNVGNKKDVTPLHVSVKNGHSQVVEVLVKSRANVNVVDCDKATPLYVAAQNGDAEIVDKLISGGADVNTADKDDVTPIHVAAYNGHIKVIKILINSGANINATTKDEWTPLHIAAYIGHVQLVDMLISLDINVNAVEKNQLTALHIATYSGHIQVAETLINSGVNVNAVDEAGDIPLHIASRKGHVEMIKGLIKMKADIYSANKLNRIPLQEAVQCGHSDVVVYFIKQLKMDINQLDQELQRQVKRILKTKSGYQSLDQMTTNYDADQLSDQLSETNSGASIGSESSDTDEEYSSSVVVQLRKNS